MSQIDAVGTSGTSDIRQSIARAAEATGVDFDYLLAQAKLESSLDPAARARTSSAAGLYQFINSTWLETLDQHGAQHGLGWADDAITRGRGGAQVNDPAMRAEIMALRYDPDAASLMAAELARDNQTALRGVLGRDPDHAELYLAHFMGRDGASNFLSRLQANPDAAAAPLFPSQARANRPVFYTPAGAPRSLAQVMETFRGRLDRAIGEGGARAPMGGAVPAEFAFAASAANFAVNSGPHQADQRSTAFRAAPLARAFDEAAAHHARRGNVSMVETLRDTFGGADGRAAALPDNVRAAYHKLKAYGL